MLPPSCLSALKSRPNERQVDPEMRDDANNTIQAASELPAGAGCQEKPNLPAKGKVFLLEIPFYRTRPAQRTATGYAGRCAEVGEARSIAAFDWRSPTQAKNRLEWGTRKIPSKDGLSIQN